MGDGTLNVLPYKPIDDGDTEDVKMIDLDHDSVEKTLVQKVNYQDIYDERQRKRSLDDRKKSLNIVLREDAFWLTTMKCFIPVGSRAYEAYGTIDILESDVAPGAVIFVEWCLIPQNKWKPILDKGLIKMGLTPEGERKEVKDRNVGDFYLGLHPDADPGLIKELVDIRTLMEKKAFLAIITNQFVFMEKPTGMIMVVVPKQGESTSTLRIVQVTLDIDRPEIIQWKNQQLKIEGNVDNDDKV